MSAMRNNWLRWTGACAALISMSSALAAQKSKTDAVYDKAGAARATVVHEANALRGRRCKLSKSFACSSRP